MASTAPPSRHALVVVNARSGSGCGPERAEELTALFAQAGLEAEVVMAHDADALRAALERAHSQGTRLVVAGGGDGTQAAVAASLAGTDSVQGVLPLGTLNHFAKDLGIPPKLEDAVRTIAQGRVLQVDVGEVNGHVFINNSSLGLYPEIVRERELQRMHLGKSKWRALASATLRATQRPHGLAVRIASEAEDQVRRTPFVFIGNNRYTMEGLDIGARESLQGGELALYMARRRGRLALLQLALRALFKRLDQAEDFEMVTGEAFVIGTHEARIRVATDGEIAMLATPLHYRIRRGALRVMVPAPAPPAK
ncbi:diacylglycerol/lipid kinase family protein [Ramlibacter alkalitolerans]|uniref:Sphingosine kinase n=1 Tax=Ramlibacter alkalitolerans TaxID=2039631 RepID=A0ABS1JPJ4_9BURK|nr:diacylglycerol kinase family protein [Ramlibacter alkalitolerans]MBL0426185.1 sphingosine kinase [Ramlibacter alkalitolerans]